MTDIKALGPAKAAKLAAAFEIGRRAAATSQRTSCSIIRGGFMSSPGGIAGSHESVRLVLLTTKMTLLRAEEIFRGVYECTATPRDILKRRSFTTPTPSSCCTTIPAAIPRPAMLTAASPDACAGAAETMGILLQDHLIIGNILPNHANCPASASREHGFM